MASHPRDGRPPSPRDGRPGAHGVADDRKREIEKPNTWHWKVVDTDLEPSSDDPSDNGGRTIAVDAKAPLADFYGPEVIEALTTGPAKLARWAIPQGQGNLLGAIQGEHPVAAAVNKVTSGSDAAAEAKKAADAVRSIQESIK